MLQTFRCYLCMGLLAAAAAVPLAAAPTQPFLQALACPWEHELNALTSTDSAVRLADAFIARDPVLVVEFTRDDNPDPFFALAASATPDPVSQPAIGAPDELLARPVAVLRSAAIQTVSLIAGAGSALLVGLGLLAVGVAARRPVA